MQKDALLLAAYLMTLPVLNVLHFIEHDHHDEEHLVISETPQDCNFCYVYQNQKIVDSNVEGLFLTSMFSPLEEAPPSA